MYTTTYLSSQLVESAGILLLSECSPFNPTLSNTANTDLPSRGRRPTRQADRQGLLSIASLHHQLTTTPISPSSSFIHLSPSTIQICVLHNSSTNETVLPKGRRDIGETRTSCALRECWEETGVCAQLISHPILSRQTVAGDAEDVPDRVRIFGGMEGPLAGNGVAGEAFITQLRALDTYTGDGRERKEGMGERLKIVYWYLGVASNSTPSSSLFQPTPYTLHGMIGTNRDWTPIWICPAEALRRRSTAVTISKGGYRYGLTYEGDREVVKAGMEILAQMERESEQRETDAQLDGSYEFVDPPVKEVWAEDNEMPYEPSML